MRKHTTNTTWANQHATNLYFTQRGDGKAIFLSLHAHLLQRHDLARPLVSRHEHEPVGALANLRDALVIVHVNALAQ